VPKELSRFDHRVSQHAYSFHFDLHDISGFMALVRPGVPVKITSPDVSAGSSQLTFIKLAQSSEHPP